MTPHEVRAAIHAFDRWRDEATTTRIERIDDPPAVAYVNDRFPRYEDANFLELASFDGEADGLIALVERVAWSAESPRRRVALLDGGVAERLAPTMRERGWRASELLVMAQLHRPDREPDPADVRVVGPEEIRPVVEAAMSEEDEDYDDPAAFDEHVRYRLHLADAVDARFLLASVDGEPASLCDVYVHGGMAQIEDVATLKAFRRRGLARATITRAIEEGRKLGARTSFLFTAVANTDAQALYRKLGFVEVDRRWGFTSPRRG